jgi:hypothetical protein
MARSREQMIGMVACLLTAAASLASFHVATALVGDGAASPLGVQRPTFRSAMNEHRPRLDARQAALEHHC